MELPENTDNFDDDGQHLQLGHAPPPSIPGFNPGDEATFHPQPFGHAVYDDDDD